MPLSRATLLHVPDMPFAYGMGGGLRVVVRVPAGSVRGGRVCFNDRYAWAGDDWAPLNEQAPLWLYARDGELEYWAADLHLQPPRLRYRFGLQTDDGLRWYGWDGLRDEPAPVGSFEFAYIAEGDKVDSPDWARGAVFYHIFADRFARGSQPHRRDPVGDWDAPPGRRTFLGGDLDGIRQKLDHIASLSVDALYLTPIFASPSNHKYDTTDYFSVDPDFGGNVALRRLVEALHERGMRVLLDGVFNHAGAEWPPFVDVRRNGRASAYADWFYLADHPRHGYETWATNVASMPKLRTSEPALRELICRVGRFWVQEFGVDGWRLDVANEVDHRLWRAFRNAVRDAQPEAFLLGEIWWPALPWLRGDQVDSVMNYPFRTSILDYAGKGLLDGEAFLDSIDWLRAQYPEPVHHHLYNLLGSHDAERPLTACRGDRRRFALASALLFTLPGAVSVYYGDEVGMEGDDDPGCRGGMVWDADRQDGQLLDLYRRLGRLRRDQPLLRSGAFERLHSEGGLAVFARGSGDDRLIVTANGGSEPGRLAADRLRGWLGGEPEVRAAFDYGSEAVRVEDGQLRAAPGQLVVVGRRVGGRRRGR